jgi:hypothetical protein
MQRGGISDPIKLGPLLAKQKPEALALSTDLSMEELMQVQCAQTHVFGSEFQGFVSGAMSGKGGNTEAAKELGGNLSKSPSGALKNAAALPSMNTMPKYTLVCVSTCLLMYVGGC